MTNPSYHSSRFTHGRTNQEDLESLNEENAQALSEMLDRYLECLRLGQKPSLGDIAQKQLHLLPLLEKYASGLRALHSFANPDSGDCLLPNNSIARNLAGQTLGEFTLLELVGYGGMGVVYRAYQPELERDVAIKLLPATQAESKKQVTRFQNEARAAGSLEHPHIVPIYTVGEEDGWHYFSMLFVEGRTVSRWIADLKDDCVLPDWRRCLQYAVQVADALHSAHEMGVIHRDIKPSNLMLDENNKIWVTDFGLARFQQDSSLTVSGDVLGTLRYMSPEQASGQSAWVDGRSDVFGLAATLFEMLHLEPVFSEEDVLDALRQSETAPLRKIPALRKDAPPALATVLAKALAPKRDYRYDNAAEFAADLRNVLAARPTIAKPPSLIDRTFLWLSHHRRSGLTAALLVAVSLVALVASLGAIAAQKQRAERAAWKATASEQLTRGAIDHLGLQIAEELAQIPQASEVRTKLLGSTLDYYQHFLASTEPQRSYPAAITLAKIGFLQLKLGDLQSARDSLLKAEQEVAQLTEDSDDPKPAWDLAACRNNLGQCLYELGLKDEAIQFFEKALTAQERLVQQRDSITPARADNLLTTAINLANVSSEISSPGTALSHCEQSIQTVESLVASDSDQSISLEATLLTRLQLARATSRSTVAVDPATALQTLRDAITRLKDKLPSFRSRTPAINTQLVCALQEYGSILALLDFHNDARTTLREAVEVGSRLDVSSAPNSRSAIILSLNSYALSCLRSRQLDAAGEALEQATQLQRLELKECPDDCEQHMLMAELLMNLSYCNQLAGHTAQADQLAQASQESKTLAGTSGTIIKQAANLAELRKWFLGDSEYFTQR